MNPPNTIKPLPDTHVDNGVLARVPAEHLGAAYKTLPDPVTASQDVIYVEVDTTSMWAGRVRLKFERYRYHRPKGKASYWTWLCRHAEPLP